MKKQKGIDISYHQKDINFSKVKADGIQFAIIRAGYRTTTDEKFFTYVQGCRNAGIKILGVYFFSYALNEKQARDEAALCIKLVEEAGLGKDIVIFFDFEYDTVYKAREKGVTLGKAQCIAHTKAFCEQVTRSGYKAGIYCNQDYYKNMYTKDLIEKYVFWLAHYTDGAPAYPCQYHQYTSSGRVAGINKNVDMDWYFMETAETTEDVNDRMNILNIARAWIGCKESNGTHKAIIDIYNEHRPLACGYTVKYTDAWCATFISACSIKAGLTHILPTECGCERMINLFKALGEWVEDDAHIPEPSEIIFYDWGDSGKGDNKGFADHVGMVESCDGKEITVIEGNCLGKVARRVIAVNSRFIRGFGVPKYSAKASSIMKAKSVDELAKEVLAGLWGNDDERRRRLTNAGYSYDDVQRRVNELCRKGPEKSVNTLAQEVISGKWGSGKAREKALTADGYDYDAVQKRVNELLSKKN